MTSARRIPPGRAGRLRLRRSLAVATRGAELLDRKLRILREEHERLLRAEEAGALAWEDRLSTAETWLLRGLVLGGEQALEAAAAGVGKARFTAGGKSTMGVRHPSGASCTIPDRPAGAALPGNAALVHAESAYRKAVLAAGEYAAAQAAARVIGAEVTKHGPASPCAATALDPAPGGRTLPIGTRSGAE